jgi:hypothetical protein
MWMYGGDKTHINRHIAPGGVVGFYGHILPQLSPGTFGIITDYAEDDEWWVKIDLKGRNGRVLKLRERLDEFPSEHLFAQIALVAG